MNAQQLLDYVIQPVLQSLGLDSLAAQQLVLGTACQESDCGEFIHQIGGPAIGIFQMEAASYDDIWLNFLAYQPILGPRVKKWALGLVLNNADEMHGNLYLATAMCRIAYYRVPSPLPTDLPGQANYWNDNYNRNPDYGTPAEYRRNWYRYASGVKF